MSVTRQLIVLGGGGFMMEDTPLLDRYFLAATGKARPRICFLPTASGDADGALLAFYRAHARYECRATHLSLFRPKTEEPATCLMQHDAIFVGGGNTRSMLALWREWGIDAALRSAYEQGTVIGGVSAGMICWFEKGLTDSNFGRMAPIDGLGWLPGGACPHFDGEPGRRPALRERVLNGDMPASWAADDGVALHFTNETLIAAVSSRAGATAWRLSRDKGQSVTEQALSTKLLTCHARYG